MTEKLFYRDSHQSDFTAKVTECVEKDGDYWIVLEQTAFFPEGGGQYADTGFLYSDEPKGFARPADAVDAAHITDVREKDGIIYHKSDKAFAIGSTVHGRIDWPERFGKMQQHTGEHIVSGLVHAAFGYDNVGFHLSDTYCTMDFNGEIKEDELRRIETLANEAVVKNLDVEVLYPSKEELANMEYRSKIEIEGQVRIVVIPGYDTCACCAPHVKKTGEIGLIRLTDSQRYKGGVRVTMLCGFRALADYRLKSTSVKRISGSLCAKENEVYEAVEHVREECAWLKQKLADKQRELLSYKVKGLDTRTGMTCMFEEALEGDGGRILMNLALEAGCEACAVFWKNEKSDAYRYCIGSASHDVRGLGKALNARFQGRGGGKAEMVQGSLTGNEKDVREWMQEEGRGWLQ